MLKKISFMLLSLILVGLTLAGSKYFTDMGTQSWYPAAESWMPDGADRRICGSYHLPESG